jgi:signal transduction histidine kinase
LFEQFWRGQPRKNGAGLGLFIVRGILSAHGSEIAVDTKEGAGARFSFSLPLATAAS